ncbi:MAG: type II toxin-antitoxin system VapC family toxin [Actinomycetota bacterium]
MIVVVDANAIVIALADPIGGRGRDVRQRLVQLDDGENETYVLPHTKLEVTQSLRKAVLAGVVPEPDAIDAIRSMNSWPFRTFPLGRPQLERVWELRNNLSAYDAAYVTAVEQLGARKRRTDAVLVTADKKLTRAPGLSINIEVID